ncbi:hypothetical protein F511_42918 [Dorcoceras hygrometricum]|uniref:Uncharacterized protein n=1 Tax=Dorcoceras hygrometricum TaxID=472368 RepID=A0A2Z7B3I5_9LAMI|nr:hypothetical protein F511_42918 [Dorcoceras hygrometricum]
MNQLEQVLRSLLSKKKIPIISIVDESVSSRKDISTVDESINSRYSRKKLRRISAGARTTKKISWSANSRSYSGSSRNAKIPRRNVLSIESQEDSVASYSVQSQEIQAQRIEEVAKRSSRGDKSAAKQLTTYEELSKLNVNC